MYIGYLITQQSREELLKVFPPIYPKVVCHHITREFGTSKDTPPPEMPNNAQVIGYVDSGDGVEALVVSINGETTRPDGKLYHITHSLADGRRAAESNNYISDAIRINPINITVEPKNFSTSLPPPPPKLDSKETN